MPSPMLNNFSSRSSSTVARGGFYYGWIVVIACLIIATVGFGIQLSFGVFFKSLEADFSLTRASTSGILSIFLFLCPLFGILGGWVLDRYGPRIIVILMGSLISLSLILVSRASALWHLFISYSWLLAMGSGPLVPVVLSIASKWFEKRRGLALGIVSAGIGVGMMVIPPVSTYLISVYGWRMAYFILALLGLLVITPLALLQKRAPSDVGGLPEGERLDIVNANPAQGQTYDRRGDFSLLHATKVRNFWLIFFMWVTFGFCIFAIMTHIVPHAIDLGISPMGAAMIVSLIGGAGVLGRLIMGRVSDSIGRKQAMIICVLLMVGAIVWLIWSSDLWMLYLFAVIFGFSEGGATTPLSALIGDTFGLRHLGVIMAVLEVGWGIGSALGPAFAGYIFDITASYFFAFLAFILAMLVNMGLVLLFKPIARA